MTAETLDSIRFFTAPREAGGDAPAAPQAASTLSHPESWFFNWATGNPGGESAPVVNEVTMLNYLAVYSCVNLIAGSLSTVPLITYERDRKKRTIERASDTRVYRILHDEFNPRMSSVVARETMFGHLLTWGNCYAQIVWNKSGSEVVEINPIGPDVVEVRHDDGGMPVYDVYQRGDRSKPIHTLTAREVLHVPAIGFDGICGYSQARIARNALRSGMATDRSAEQFATNGFKPPGVIEMPAGKKFGSTQEGIKFIEDFRKIHMVKDSQGKVVVLQDGATWKQTGVDMESAQTLESRKFTRGEIAGMYKVPPHMIGDVEKSTSWGTGIAEQVDGLIKFCFSPWGVKFEQEINRKLFRGSPGMYAEHLYAALERADIVKRFQAYKEAVQIGMMSPNEGRAAENQNPHPGGDVYLFPLNFARVDSDGNDIAPPAPAQPANPSPGQPKESAAPNEALRASLRKACVSATLRCLRKECEQAKRAASKPAEFFAWLTDFYGRHAEMVADHLGPVAEAWEAAFGKPAFGVAQHLDRSREDLLAAADGPPAGFAERVERTCSRWLSERIADVAGGLVPVPTRSAA
jgi:HK97 family phage portal protein